MTKKKKIIISITSVVAAAAVISAAGATLALSMSDNRSSGSITTAGMNIPATVQNVKVYSTVGDRYQESANKGDDLARAEGLVTPNGGLVKLTTDGKDESIFVTGFVPGDKVEFEIAVTSDSTISFNYHAEIWVDSHEGESLFNQLYFGSDKYGVIKEIGADAEKDGDFVKAFSSDPVAYTAKQQDIEKVKIEISLPVTATNAAQGQTVKFRYKAIGITSGDIQEEQVAEIIRNGEPRQFWTIKDAVDYANNGDTISVIGNTAPALEEGTVKIDKPLTIKGIDKDGRTPVLRGARFIVDEGTSATFENVNFTGASYIDATQAGRLQIDGCKADVEPVRFFDTIARNYLTDSAFIVSGSSTAGITLNIKNSEIVSGKGAAVSMRAPLKSNSEISGNEFGTEERPYDGTSVIVLNGADADAYISVKENTLFGAQPLYLGGTGRYLVISEKNTAYGVKDGVFADGTEGSAFVDSGSKIGESALLYTNVKYGVLAFGGVDVTLDESNKIIAGKIGVLSDKVADMFTKYVGAPNRNAIVIYNDDGAAYLNTANNDVGYEINKIG